MATTTTATTALTRAPFDLPEIRHQLSQFLTVQDAISCALVSKLWTNDFVSAIWFKNDFKVHSRFTDLSPELVAKHGHHIRVVKNVVTLQQMASIAHTSVNKLRELYIEIAGSVGQDVSASEVVSRNFPSLQVLWFFSDSVPKNKLESLSFPALAPFFGAAATGETASCLKTLRLSDMCLTHDGLEAILQASPALFELRLRRVEIVGRSTRVLHHVGVKELSASIELAFQGDPADPSLLSYFPNLSYLHIWRDDSRLRIPTTKIKKDLALYCPHLAGYGVEDSANAISRSCSRIVKNLSEFVFDYERASVSSITSILLHRESLLRIDVFHDSDFDFEEDNVAAVSNRFRESSQSLQLIPRSCPQLQVLNLYPHEMDMDEVEKGEWVCKNLRTLYIRVRGLDTTEKIAKAIALWRRGCWRRRQEKAETSVGEDGKLDETDMSIEVRVARHLLKFEQLWWVWLGYQIWAPI
ncbi:hypothetical protein BGX24_008263 [Mortierella sp. AD032]|nr:hypothetical protein BGX24_008263 [Mortierella sp. AD032]